MQDKLGREGSSQSGFWGCFSTSPPGQLQKGQARLRVCVCVCVCVCVRVCAYVGGSGAVSPRVHQFRHSSSMDGRRAKVSLFLEV